MSGKERNPIEGRRGPAEFESVAARDPRSDRVLGQVVGRREVLAGAAALALIGRSVPAGGSSPPERAPAVAMPPILPRSTWDLGVGPTGPLEAEDVRFLLIHHTAEPGNDYGENDVVGLLQAIRRFHTGADKGWPDIAYNFMVDRFGRIHEARTGSIDGPVRGSATGGNQGYSQLCCFLGNFASEPPTAEAQSAMIELLTWLADRYRVPVGPGSVVEFSSLGSDRWPAGQTVRVDPIAAHRDVSETSCPGDACIELVRATFPAAVAARLAPAGPAPTSSVPSSTSPTSSVPRSSAPTSSTPRSSAPGSSAPMSTGVPGPSAPGRDSAVTTAGGGEAADLTTPHVSAGGGLGFGFPAIVAAAVVGVAGVVAGVLRRRQPDRSDHDT